ncbi:hypothetical protein EG327_004571 [Venturia inaequalis]|uniref:Amino acid permease/ SLC12A domain-containing protein n=1 Tax=Venturia inaequalis TaxID=5025 RepID=A0A8H3VBC5_VENIN|nr:hypothetical protein EG327_004571 [Venturia inaequalis]
MSLDSDDKKVAALGTAESNKQDSNIHEAETSEYAANGNVIDDGLQRGLKNRHLQMIAFGGVVGASIWYGTGYAISYTGPVGALICFFIIGVDVYFVMQSLGEMSTLFPIQGAFVEHAGRFVDPALAFAIGWNYWYLWVTNLAGDYNSISLIMGLWTDKLPTYAWILIAWAFFQCTSLLGVVVYGEMEFWLASWKLLCVLGGFLIAILINTGAIGGDYIGFRFWKTPGPFVNGINGFGQTFVLAAVYYCGTEMLALTAAESKNPKRDLPKAIRQTFNRILIIFIGLVFFAGLIVPSNNDQLLNGSSKSGKSPWTIALVKAGWPGAGNLINIVMITAQLSSVNSCIYVASRTLVSLASTGRAPRFFAKTTTNGVPINAIVFSNLLGLLSLLNYTTGPGKIFGYLVAISGAATFIAWGFIGVTHIRMRQAWILQGHTLDELPYQALFYPYGAYFIISLNFFLVFISGYGVFIGGFRAVDFVFDYIVIVIFVALYVFWKVFKKTEWVRLEDMDLVSGRKVYMENGSGEVEGGEGEREVAWYVKVKRFVFS